MHECACGLLRRIAGVIVLSYAMSGGSILNGRVVKLLRGEHRLLGSHRSHIELSELVSCGSICNGRRRERLYELQCEYLLAIAGSEHVPELYRRDMVSDRVVGMLPQPNRSAHRPAISSTVR